MNKRLIDSFVLWLVRSRLLDPPPPPPRKFVCPNSPTMSILAFIDMPFLVLE